MLCRLALILGFGVIALIPGSASADPSTSCQRNEVCGSWLGYTWTIAPSFNETVVATLSKDPMATGAGLRVQVCLERGRRHSSSHPAGCSQVMGPRSDSWTSRRIGSRPYRLWISLAPIGVVPYIRGEIADIYVPHSRPAP
jgi:hypothetical protein